MFVILHGYFDYTNRGRVKFGFTTSTRSLDGPFPFLTVIANRLFVRFGDVRAMTIAYSVQTLLEIHFFFIAYRENTAVVFIVPIINRVCAGLGVTRSDGGVTLNHIDFQLHIKF